MNATVSGDGAGTDFDLPGLTRDRPMGMDKRRLTDQVAAQVGHDFLGLGPRQGLVRGARCARAGRRAIFHLFRVMNSKDFDFFSVLSIAYSSDKYIDSLINFESTR
jgi:hypothetical protein